jgi:CheY-like chemotaxis protein/two-component sensor histidine kinase
MGEAPKLLAIDEPSDGSNVDVQPELLAMLGHELRNPLAPIRNSAQLLRSLCTDSRQLQAVEIISRNVVHLTRMLDDLLDAARLKRGAFVLKKQTVDIGVIVREMLEDVQPAIDSHRQSLLVSLPAMQLQMYCDPIRLGQILFNLMDNANRYTPEGGTISLKASTVDQELVIEVADNGAGIDPKLLPRLFNVFAQAPQPLDRSQGGLGLGLAIARNLAEMHGGTIEAESAGIGAGSRFTLRLPIGSGEPEDAISKLKSENAAAAGSSARVLIIEDNVDIASTLDQVLTDFGYLTNIAHTGEQGLEVAERFRPQAVLIDIGLPGINGFEVAQRLEKSRATAESVLIAMSGYGLDTLRDKTAHLVFRHYLVKPFDPLNVASLIAAELQKDSAK